MPTGGSNAACGWSFKLYRGGICLKRPPFFLVLPKKNAPRPV